MKIIKDKELGGVEMQEQKETEPKKNFKQLAKEKTKRHMRNFKKEFTKAINTAILATFGFLIALVWRDVITEFVNKISSKSPVQGKLVGALITTLICVIGIMILSKIFSEKENK